MTPSEEVRKLLDERGVEWSDSSTCGKTGSPIVKTRWCNAEYVEWKNGTTRFSTRDVTPAQAIAATVGEEHEMHICKACGVAYELSIIDKGFGKSRFCPNCGYKELYQ